MPVSRFERITELLRGEKTRLGAARCAALLRDRLLPGGQNAGNGHRGSLNPLIATHAVVVPTHGAAQRVGELGAFGDRVRVIAGAAPAGFAVPVDEVGRRRALGVPDGSLVVVGSAAASSRAADAFAAVARAGTDLPVVVLDAPEGEEQAVLGLAARAGLHEGRVRVPGMLEDADRAAVLGGAVALIAPSQLTAFPWRVIEALAVGVPAHPRP